jgi:DNA-binding transcriptional MerR regulator
MAARVTIGEFSTMTRLSRKALRHYHDLGLLEPVEVDPVNGYRYYDTTQLDIARLIRRFRDLEMPVPDLKAYVAARDAAARGAIVSAHLDRMQAQLRQTQDAVASLRALLSTVGPRAHIEVRAVGAAMAIAITETVRLDDLVPWWQEATRELDEALRRAGHTAQGSLGATFSHALFADEQGQASVWFPVARATSESGRVRMTTICAGLFAVAIHDGPDARIDETYAALGTYVAERGIGADGPVRERYLAGVLGDPTPLITEILWPVTASRSTRD